MITNQCPFQAWAEATKGLEASYYLMAEILFPAYVQLEINGFHLTDTTGQRLNALSDLVIAIEAGRWPITNQQE